MRLLFMGVRFVQAGAPALLLLTANLAAAADDGCWVHAFAREQFRPPVTTYTGPSHERMFMSEARSLVVGPGARLVGYDRGDYRRQTLELGPGERLGELVSVDFHRRVDSFEVLCTGVRR